MLDISLVENDALDQLWGPDHRDWEDIPFKGINLALTRFAKLLNPFLKEQPCRKRK